MGKTTTVLPQGKKGNTDLCCVYALGFCTNNVQWDFVIEKQNLKKTTTTTFRSHAECAVKDPYLPKLVVSCW